ncbi:hypothetical protein FNV43_RR07711 [Rhamnella rubrinervis]|uniref:BHLH domain-containing protein n=1 Tax=Rhamnella rubrinervis TaxID=2594499 RepID=A0A8K0HFS5_9ROSA|nr:hypothetical protein FNV43_RR07711 [Rhamnella rubrinervis]
MAEEFQAGICGGNWWINSSRNAFTAASPCSVGLNDFGSIGWACDMVDIKARSSSSCGESDSVVCDTSINAFQDVQKPHQAADSVSCCGTTTTTGSILIDSTLQMMGFGLSTSPTSDLTQAFLLDSSHEHHQIQKDWSPENFSGVDNDASMNVFKPNQDFSGSVMSSQTLSAGFPLSSSASYGLSSPLLQSFFDGESHQPQQSLCSNQSMNYSSASSNYRTNNNNNNNNNSSNIVSSPSWPRIISPFLRSSVPKQQQQPARGGGGLNFSNSTTPFWNASAAKGLNDIRGSLYSTSSQSQYLAPAFDEKTNCRSNLTAKCNTDEDIHDSGSMVVKKTGGDQPVFKRPRLQTPSPLPTFKVRKEKLGDRITALQQLVSPFGKTDTASVLHEAIEYIKFLHDQVSVLSSPYMKNGAPIQHQQGSDKLKDPEGPKQDLKNRGLCLVPISSTFPVANETTADFWTPTFGGTYR